MKKIAIVAACHIETSPEWKKALEVQGEFADIIIVDDSDGKLSFPKDWDVYDYARQKAFLGPKLYKLFEQFHKSSSCKQFGLWMAYQLGYETVIVIDSDCIVSSKFVEDHLYALYDDNWGGGWDNPLSETGFYSRGYPYSKRDWQIVANMGLWTHELDLYGTDRVGKGNIPSTPADIMFEHSVNATFFPLSGMNVSFRREMIPYMLFLPNFSHGENKFSRHDDIWGGYIFQKIMQAKHQALSYGLPFVYHDTVVVPEEDAAEEVAMIKYEDEWYDFIDHTLVINARNLDKLAPNEIFSWISHELAIHEIFSELAPAFILQAQLYA